MKKREPHTAATRLLRPREAAIMLAISERKLWQLGNSGALPVIRLGRATRYGLEDVQNFIHLCRIGSEARR